MKKSLGQTLFNPVNNMLFVTGYYLKSEEGQGDFVYVVSLKNILRVSR